ncbi:MAG: sulfotransferase domain-containing protein [Qipengyuania sp.]|jgi:sulfotransferase 6B1|uniref:sulfotransferase domain-containing protein n=1 Tax=Qipengyuania sp. TaxID=2004515 RepID=UPI0030036CB4
MSKHFVQNSTVRKLGLTAYRLRARSQFWRTGPRVFINSVPKAGTHLVTAELAKVDQMQNSYLHLDNRRFSDSSDLSDGSGQIRLNVITADIAKVQKGQFFTGHVAWDRGLEDMLREAGIKIVFVTRDPRAVLVSRYNYILGLKRHWLHRFLNGYSKDPVERYRLLIEGHMGTPKLLSTTDRLLAYIPWIEREIVHTIRFEDVVGTRGGRSDVQKEAELKLLATFLGLDVEDVESETLTRETTSVTFRNGQADGWREELPAPVLKLMNQRCGEVIERMGYAI